MNGVTPVPGPIQIIGFVSYGIKKVEGSV